MSTQPHYSFSFIIIIVVNKLTPLSLSHSHTLTLSHFLFLFIYLHHFLSVSHQTIHTIYTPPVLVEAARKLSTKTTQQTPHIVYNAPKCLFTLEPHNTSHHITMNKVKSALSTGTSKVTGVFQKGSGGNDLERLSNAAEAQRQASVKGRSESSLNRIHLIIHAASWFFTFLAVCLTGAVAGFQAKWVKISGGTGFVLFLLLLNLVLSSVLLVIPVVYDRWDKARRPAQFLAQPRSSLILNLYGGFIMITVAIITSAAGFGSYCKGLGNMGGSSSSDSTDPSGATNIRRQEAGGDGSVVDDGSTAEEKDMSGYASGYAGWCRTRQASSMFAWFSFICWLSLAVLAGLAFHKERQLARRREPSFIPPPDDEAEAYGVGPNDDVFDDKHEEPQRPVAQSAPRPARHDYARVQTNDSAMARPSVDAYGAFDGDMPGSDRREQPSRTMQMAYSDPYAQIRQSVLNDNSYGHHQSPPVHYSQPPPPQPPQQSPYNMPPSYTSGGYQ